jgi:hypothetical protein
VRPLIDPVIIFISNVIIMQALHSLPKVVGQLQRRKPQLKAADEEGDRKV